MATLPWALMTRNQGTTTESLPARLASVAATGPGVDREDAASPGMAEGMSDSTRATSRARPGQPAMKAICE